MCVCVYVLYVDEGNMKYADDDGDIVEEETIDGEFGCQFLATIHLVFNKVWIQMCSSQIE